MKKLMIPVAVLAIAGLIYAFVPRSQAVANTGEFKWYTWEEAIKANKKNPKKIMVDCYTDWCGWCKRMDANTFSDPKVQEYLNKHFYAVKFDAEQKEDILYDGKTFKFVANGRRGYHELAATLLNGRLSYPSIAYLSENEELITVSPGYKEVPDFMNELKYVAEEHYATKTWQEYLQSGGSN